VCLGASPVAPCSRLLSSLLRPYEYMGAFGSDTYIQAYLEVLLRSCIPWSNMCP
jgi:hypothetical protein